MDINLKSNFKNEFCDDTNKEYGSCSNGRQSWTYSILYTYKNIENDLYKRFGNNNNGGTIYTVDYCPINGQRYDESGYNYFYGSCKIGSPNYGIYNKYINIFKIINNNNNLMIWYILTI